jgi:hypothetical protein
VSKYPVIPALLEWFNAREAIFEVDFGKLPLAEHMPYWTRLGNAEKTLMDEVRKMRHDVLNNRTQA